MEWLRKEGGNLLGEGEMLVVTQAVAGKAVEVGSKVKYVEEDQTLKVYWAEG